MTKKKNTKTSKQSTLAQKVKSAKKLPQKNSKKVVKKAQISKQAVKKIASNVKNKITARNKKNVTSKSKKTLLTKPAPAKKTSNKKAETKIQKSVKKPQKLVKEVAKKKSVQNDKIVTNKNMKELPQKSKQASSVKETPKTLVAQDVVKLPTRNFEKNIQKPALKEVAKKDSGKKDNSFKTSDYVIYPSHGVGRITSIDADEVAGQKIDCMAIQFEKERLKIKVPMTQIKVIGIRALANKQQISEVLEILKSGIKKLKGMWSRRAQEYESKINSGDIFLLAEVIRDLTRDIDDSERSYSERIIYETAIYRLACEYSAVAGISFEEAKNEIISTAKNKVDQGEKGAEVIKLKKDFDDDFDFDDLEEVAEEDSEAENDNFKSSNKKTKTA